MEESRRYHILIAPKIIKFLQRRPRSKEELAMFAGASRVTIQRCLVYLREQNVPIHFSRHDNLWHIEHVDIEGELTLFDLVKKKIVDPGHALIFTCAYRARSK